MRKMVVYFDVEKYNKTYRYGKLSGRVLDDLMTNTRSLDGQSDKKNSFDFALWKKALPEHIMRWPSPWSDGFPGWHMECSAMSTKYLGEQFDIHGGGMDLMFPHHECEIAQNTAALGHESVHYWMHNNMLTINGQKMGKSLGNFITLEEMFTGNHPMLEKAYSPMTIRFFTLQAHYRSTLDFSNEGLQAAEKGLQRMQKAYDSIRKIKPSTTSSLNVDELNTLCLEAMSDDINSPIAISVLFDWVRNINLLLDGKEQLTADDLQKLQQLFDLWMVKVLGLTGQMEEGTSTERLSGLVEILLNLRMDAKKNKNFAQSDKIRDELSKLGIVVMDKKDGFDWELE